MEYGRRTKSENIVYRYKTIIGNKIRSKNLESQNTDI